MQSLRSVENLQKQWDVSDDLPGMLHTPGTFRCAGQTPSVRIAGSHRALQGEPWPGKSAGIRRPENWETKLSDSEVAHAIAHNLI
jgi:hypothetical protein